MCSEVGYLRSLGFDVRREDLISFGDLGREGWFYDWRVERGGFSVVLGGRFSTVFWVGIRIRFRGVVVWM